MADSQPHSLQQRPHSITDGASQPTDSIPATDSATASEAINKSRKFALLIVFLVVFIDLFGFGIVIPLLPRYADDFIQPLFFRDVTRGVILGCLMASFSAMQFIFAPIWGRISDRIGRRPVLLLGLANSVVFYTLFGVASLLGGKGTVVLGLILLFVSRLGAGIAGATVGTAQAVIADSTTPEGRSRGMALIGAAFGVGFLIGPLLGAGSLWLFPNFLGAPGFLAAGLSLVAAILGWSLLPETRKPGVSHGRRKWFDGQGLRLVLQSPGVGFLILIFFLSVFAFAMFEPTLGLVTKSPKLGLSDQTNFLVFAYVGLVLALAQGFLYRRLALRISETPLMGAGAVLMAIGLLGVGGVAWKADAPSSVHKSTNHQPPSSTTLRLTDVTPSSSEAGSNSKALLLSLLAALAVAVTGFAFMVPSAQALISRLSDPNKQGEILGINQSANAVARILGPFGGMVFYEILHVLPYLFSTCLLSVVFFMVLLFRRRRLVLDAEPKEAPHAS